MRYIITVLLFFRMLMLPGIAGNIVFQQGNITIYLPAGEPAPVGLALEALNRDILKVTGRSAQVISVNRPEETGDAPAVVLLDNSSADFLLPPFAEGKVNGTESHRVYAYGNKVYLQGFDMRGLIYAIYTFSEKILGVPPLWYWCSWQPTVRETLLVSSAVDLYFPSPQVEYRAWFPNDTDLFTPWRSLSTENNTLWLETMLRLKLNTVESGGAVYYSTNGTARLQSTPELIKNYGLILSFTHTVCLGTHFAGWENYWTRIRKMTAPPALLVAGEEQLKEFWEHAVNVLKDSGSEILWQIAFRGINDIPFWESFADAPASDAERAAVINRMWGIQMDILRRATGNPNPPVKLTFYNELSDFMALHLLEPPAGENVIRSYVATRRDHYPSPDLMLHDSSSPVKIGYYMNLQFTSSGAHLAQAEGPWKMELNYRVAGDRAPLHYAVVNAGNLREFLLSLSAFAAMMWDMTAYDTDTFLNAFCEMYFGSAHASAIAGLYKDFFDAYWQQKNPDFIYRGNLMERQYLFQDLRYKQSVATIEPAFFKSAYNANPLYRLEDRYFNIVPADNGATSQIDALLNRLPAVAADFGAVATAAASLLPQLPESRRAFFLHNLLSQARFMEQLNIMLYRLAAAYKQKWTDRQAAAQEMDAAYRAALSAKSYLFQSGEGIFEAWYAGDAGSSKFNIDDMISRIENMKNSLPSTGMDKPAPEKIRIAFQENKISITGCSGNATLKVFNAAGVSRLTARLCGSEAQIPFRALPGVYICYLDNQANNEIIKQIIINP
jgi:hypothetical protein